MVSKHTYTHHSNLHLWKLITKEIALDNISAVSLPGGNIYLTQISEDVCLKLSSSRSHTLTQHGLVS